MRALRASGLERCNPAVGAARRKLVAMQARAFPQCLPGVGRNDISAVTVGKRAPAFRVRAVDGPSAAVADLPPAEVTWQIVVGAVAGATPFVVAGVEFSKRIIEQKKCEVCGGSGLVMKNDLYVRCQGCGGFLPWQSWRRFFKG